MRFITQLSILGILILGLQTLQAQKKALHHADLGKYLPTSVKGYNPSGEIEGASFNSTEASYSTATREYKKGDLEMTIVLIDYTEAAQVYQATTMAWSMGMSIDTNEEKANAIKVNGFTGWEVFDKKEKDANIVLGIHNRYIFTAECTDCTTQFLREVAQSINLASLPQ